MSKTFLLGPSEFRPIAEGHGACFATDRITVEGHPVRFMYRDEPDFEQDSGWRFFSDVDEDDAYLGNPDNFEIYDVNTIANYDPTIVPHLGAEIGSCFVKYPDQSEFVRDDDEFPQFSE